MLAKNSSRSPFTNKTSQQLHCEISKGAPYTQLPIPVSSSSKRFSTENEFPQNSNYSNKIYKINSNNRNVQMVRSADCKIRKNPGLMNIGRKINLNEYGEDNLYCEAQAIRKFGMQYRRKLMERYHNESNAKFNMYNRIQPKRQIVINHQKQIVNWYESRNEGLNSMMSNLLTKMQRELGAKQYGKEQRQVLLSQLNRDWEQEAVKLKKCFDL